MENTYHNVRIFWRKGPFIFIVPLQELMTFHLAHIHDYNRFIAVDIGSHRVRAGMYGIDDGQIVFFPSSSVRQNRKNIVQGSIVDLRWMADSIERACTQVSQDFEDIPDNIILSFSSSSFVCDSISTQYVRSDFESALTMKEIDEMIKKIEASSFSRARKRCKQQFGISHDDIRLVSSTITSITIDGQVITNPIWFPWRNICLTVLNVFVPASEFNIVRSVIASLWKNIISLIPTPLIFPKLLETSDYSDQDACIIDIGHTHTTILITEKNTIINFETFPIGTDMLTVMIGEAFPDLSLIQIENILCSPSQDESVQKEVRLFLEYLFDVISGFLEEQNVAYRQNNLFCYGGFFENKSLFDLFSRSFENTYGRFIRKKRIIDIIEAPENNERLLTFWLALMAQDLLMVKKDPIIRVLRYVLYNYE